jgi:hypothetical protein
MEPERGGLMANTSRSVKKSDFFLPLLAMLSLSVASPRAEDAASPGFQPTPAKTVLSEPREFDRGTLMSPGYPGNSVSGFSLLNPNRFSMHQSYSVNFASGSLGSMSSGVYLNTLSYRLADPLTLTADVGFYSPLYNSTGAFSKNGFQDPRLNSSLILPHIGLEYKASENTSFSIHLLNGQDAYRAYGSAMDPFMRTWPR